jgi:hypothetical protein
MVLDLLYSGLAWQLTLDGAYKLFSRDALPSPDGCFIRTAPIMFPILFILILNHKRKNIHG